MRATAAETVARAAAKAAAEARAVSLQFQQSLDHLLESVLPSGTPEKAGAPEPVAFESPDSETVFGAVQHLAVWSPAVRCCECCSQLLCCLAGPPGSCSRR